MKYFILLSALKLKLLTVSKNSIYLTTLRFTNITKNYEEFFYSLYLSSRYIQRIIFFFTFLLEKSIWYPVFHILLDYPLPWISFSYAVACEPKPVGAFPGFSSAIRTTNQCQTDDVNLTGPATAIATGTPPSAASWKLEAGPPFTLKLKFIWIYNILFQFKFKSANICHEHCQVQGKLTWATPPKRRWRSSGGDISRVYHRHAPSSCFSFSSSSWLHLRLLFLLLLSWTLSPWLSWTLANATYSKVP